MRLTNLSASIFLLFGIVSISNAVNPLSPATNTVTVCNRIGTNGTPLCPAPSPTNQDNSDTNRAAGNPINVITGNKFESAQDIEATGGEYALRLNRYYNSRSTQRGLFGKGWRSDYEMQLQDTGDKIDVLQADGRKISFIKTADTLDNSSLLITRYKADKAELGYLERTQSIDISKPAWIWHLPNGKQLQFVAHKQSSIVNSDGRYRFGQLSRVTENINQPNSAYWSLTYDVKGNLAQVQNHQGDTLKFSYQTTKYGLPKISITKSGRNNSGLQIWQYFLDKQGNLAQVVSPTGNRTGYAYTDPNDPHNLTAKYSYDKQGNKQLITKWSYDAYDRAISSEHQNGVEKVTISFDPDTLIPMPADHIFTNIITNSVGETTEYRYRYQGDDAQLLSAIGAGCATCGEPNVSYEYDSAGRVIKENRLDDEGRIVSSVSREFDKFGRLTKENIRPKGSAALESSVHYEYVSNNPQNPQFSLVAKQWSASVASGKQTGIEYQYNDHGLPIRKLEFGYTPDGERITRTYLMAYDNKGNITQVALQNNLNPDSDSIVLEAYSWFEDGSLKSASRPNLGITTRFEHNEHGLTTKVERENKDDVTTIRFEYDDRQYPISMSQYHNGTLVNGVKYKRNNLGDITSVTDLDDNFIASYAYDDANRNLGEITPQMATLRHLDTESRPIVDYKFTARSADKLSYQYDSKGRILGVGRDDTQLVAVNYSKDNNTAEIIGASGAQLIAHKDDDEFNEYELPNLWDGLGVKRTHIKPMQSGVVDVKQNNGLVTKYGYDDFGRIVYIDSPSTGRNLYTYNEQDQLIGIKLASGVQVTYQYDQKGRRTHKLTKQNNNTVQEVSWKYNNNDQLISAKGSHQTTEYKYDEQGRVTEKRIVLEGLTKPLVTHFSYDKQGSINKIILPDGIELFSKDKGIRYKAPDDIKARIMFQENEIRSGQHANISYQLGQHIVMGHYYDDEGKFSGLSYRTLPKNGSNPFIKSANASTPNLSPLFSQQWARTSDGIVEQITEVDYQGKPTEHNYLYDSQYHLISSSHQPIKLDSDLKPVTTAETTDTDKNVYQARYLYDELGNRLLGDEQSQPLNKYQYDDKARLTQITPLAKAVKGNSSSVKNIIYNEAGLPTQYGDYRLEYTAGQVSTIKDSKDQLIAEYTYNDLGQRIKKRVYQKDKKALAKPETTYYVYEDSQLQHELDGDGNMIRHYVYIGDTLTATIDYPKEKHGKLLTPEQSGISLWQRSSNWVSKLWQQEDAYPNVNYVITDYLGRPRQVRTAETNELLWQFTPTAFGGSVDKAFADKDYQLNIRFPGQYEDSETGLYYNHWRYYDQNTGRYISADPLGLGGGENLYTYVNATPTHFIDQPGLLLFAFDGTGNQDYGSGTSFSNVVKFRDAYRADPNEPKFPNTLWTGQSKKFGSFANNNAFYISGAGTEDYYTKIGSNGEWWTGKANAKDAAIGTSLRYRVDQMLTYMSDYLDKVLEKREKEKIKGITKIKLDVVGFSRGAASARMFASKLERLISQDYNKVSEPYLNPHYQSTSTQAIKWKHGINNLCSKVDIQFNYLGLWDTVPSLGPNLHNDEVELNRMGYSLKVSSKWNKVAHAVAVNEHRAGFPVHSIFTQAPNSSDSSRLERGFLGAHSDIGGGYAEGDLSDVALMWIVGEAQKTGIELTIPDEFKAVTNPTVHDSLGVYPLSAYNPSREFLWAGQSTTGSTQFESKDHLVFNWENSKTFENEAPSANKFQKIYTLSEEYKRQLKAGCSPRFGSCIRGGRFPNEVLKDIKALKSEGVDEDLTILYDSKNRNEKIAIQNYINWLKTNGYDLNINTD